METLQTSGDEELLEQVEREYRFAESAYQQALGALLEYDRANPTLDAVTVTNGIAFTRVGALWLNPGRDRLCAARTQALKHRNKLLEMRADLLRRIGRIR